jgi:DNA helicase HerA-like ATPase
MKDGFINAINEGYQKFEGPSILAGAGMIEGEAQPEAEVRIPLKTLNRHGLIAGATGTGKTVSLQVLAEQFSLQGIPVVLMDMKGDLSGLAAPGTSNKHIVKRHSFLPEEYAPKGFPLELLSLSGQKGTQLRATATEFGPVLMSKILGLNDTQQSILSVVFKYCDDHDLPLIDLSDLKKTLQFAINEGKEDLAREYGRLHTSSVNTILRKILELEQQGAEKFFGELSFDVQDLLRKDSDGLGTISVIRLNDIQDKPKLFSTFVLSLLAEIYETFPEIGDQDRPKLVLFIDEAHLFFKEASQALRDQIESIIKLIRSKGVGIFFCTQNPDDIPEEVLGQLGLKIQHALRAFTAKDRKAIKRASENFPLSNFYKTDELLTQLGIGEALVTALNEKGIPTPLVATLMRPPKSRMGILSDLELNGVMSMSSIKPKYDQAIDRESAFEILNQKLNRAKESGPQTIQRQPGRAKSETNTGIEILDELSKNTMVRQMGRTIGRELVRGLFGVLGMKR